MDEMDGDWKLEHGNQLTVFVMYEGRKQPIVFTYSFKDQYMILVRQDALRTNKAVYYFVKKEG